MRYVIAAMLVMSIAIFTPAQSKRDAAYKGTPAYAEVLLRRTEIAAELEALLADYTDTNPKILDLKYEMSLLDDSLKKMISADSATLTVALGKLIVKRSSLDVEVHRLTRTLNADHPDYKRAKRRLDVFDAAVKQILH